MLSLTAVLTLFLLLAISSATYFLAGRIKVPYTVLLVAVGTFILVPLSKTHGFSFLNDFHFTPELLFYIFLPILLFESAYNMNIRHVMENIRSITLLAVVSLFISATLIGVGLYYIFPLIGIEVPLIVTLIFGALISATDPVAVLALFKDFGAPRRLSLIFEGESIFNDGTAVTLFLIVLGVALEGYHGAESIGAGLGMFAFMVVGGIFAGLFAGGIFAKAIGYAQKSEFVQITLTVVLAHLTFIITDYISENLVIFGFHIHLSAIIATTIASMVFGNYGRAKISPKAEEFVEKFWGQFAFFANSLIFILIGLIFATLPFDVIDFTFPVVIAILVVAAARALSIYPVIGILNKTKSESHIPRTWTHLLAWGSLRGALAVTMVLLIPDTLTVPGWIYSFSPKEFILALTIGCIFATLFIKATTINWLMQKLKIGDFTEREKLSYEEARALIYAHALVRLEDFVQKGYVDSAVAEKVLGEWKRKARQFKEASKKIIGESQGDVSEQVLRLYAIGIEIHHLRELYSYHEVTEKVYKRILGKLTIQQEQTECNVFNPDTSVYIDRKDVFEQLANVVRRIAMPSHLKQGPEEKYMYYRAQLIISRKVVKELCFLEKSQMHTIFGETAFSHTKATYESFRDGSKRKMDEVSKQHPQLIRALSEKLACRGMQKVEEAVLQDLLRKGMLTPKTHIAIRDELDREAEERGPTVGEK